MRMVPRRLALALGGVLSAAGLASGQPAPFGPDPLGPPTFPRAQVSIPVAPVVTTAPAGMVAAPGYASSVGGGCATCGGSSSAYASSSPHIAKAHSFYGRPFSTHPAAIGEGCAATPGCSSYAQERTFFWGGCSQFFGAGNKCDSVFGNRNARGGLFGGKHDLTPPGPGGLGNPNPCVYGSYTNR